MCVTSIFLRNGPLWSREERAMKRERERKRQISISQPDLLVTRSRVRGISYLELFNNYNLYLTIILPIFD